MGLDDRVLRGLEAFVKDPDGGDALDPGEIAPGVTAGVVLAGKYRVEEVLGRGGMGVVLGALHLELGTRVAIKLLLAADADQARFLREAQAASRIESEHVARVLDVGRTSKGRPFIVLEYLRGTDLARRLAEAGPLAVPVAIGYILQACAAIAEAHAQGIVHRDLKPSNLFIVERRDGTELVKVLDFGISKLTRPLDDSSLALTVTADSAVMGSIAYMSPEQIESSTSADARSDVWSLGVVTFELVTGTRPFDGDRAVAVAARIASSPPRSLRDARPDAPATLETVIAKCLAKDPSDRYASVDELARALQPLATGGSSPLVAAPVRHRALVVSFALLALLVLIFAWARSGSSPSLAEPIVAAEAASPEASAWPFTPLAPAAASASASGAPRASVSAAPSAVIVTPPRARAPFTVPASPRSIDLRDPALENR